MVLTDWGEEGGSYLDNGKVTITALARETTSRFFHRLTKSLLLSLSPENTYNDISRFIASIYILSSHSYAKNSKNICLQSGIMI